MEPYFSELKSIDPSSDLYKSWIRYALSLTREDVLFIVRNGLTHQARSLRSMINEAVPVAEAPRSLRVKLEIVVSTAQKRASLMR